MVFLKEVADLLEFNQSVKIVKGKFVDNIIRPMNMLDADLNLQKTNIIT